ncbi:CesT family type III secretion system chaperone [Rugamonas aquatica]|uniref:Type III secretion chaperone SycN n=1 Tax=Rugamonas aquatica TaxID=2743357 RepID=A0A6A7N748_9BURK|nr:CesT family type III secretion system chaperone [Rugamonas aquatica]MQA40702.1 hypothetical protein [Rugamonas aquatica]
MTPMIASTLEEFGRSIGMDALATDATGTLSLRLGRERRLSFHASNTGVLLMLSAPLAAGNQLETKCRALTLCRLSQGWHLPVRAGLTSDGHLVFTTQLEAREFRLHVLEQACELLGHLHDQIHFQG